MMSFVRWKNNLWIVRMKGGNGQMSPYSTGEKPLTQIPFRFDKLILLTVCLIVSEANNVSFASAARLRSWMNSPYTFNGLFSLSIGFSYPWLLRLKVILVDGIHVQLH